VALKSSQRSILLSVFWRAALKLVFLLDRLWGDRDFLLARGGLLAWGVLVGGLVPILVYRS
jgi:hypothetical protein